jgi:hypothetical protein
MNLKNKWADFKVWKLNNCYRIWSWIKHFLQTLTYDLKLDGNGDLRLFVFVFIYVLFSVVGAYNFAHLTAFIYIIWLLERQHGN